MITEPARFGCARRAAALLAAFVASLALPSCGGGDQDADTATTTTRSSAGASPGALARGAFGPNPAARSGVMNGRVTITVTGVPGYRAPISTRVSGRFRYRAGSALPDYRLTLGARDRSADLVTVGRRTYVVLGSTGFAVPASVRRRLERASERGRNGLTRTLEQFGIAPWRWEIDKRVAGTERIDGVRVVRVETGVDVDRFLRDANTLAGLLAAIGVARATGLPPRIPDDARRVLVRSVTFAKGASWIAVGDRVMRQAGLTIRFRVPRAERSRVGGIATARVVAKVTVSQVGRAQRITAPQTTGPWQNFQLLLGAG